MRKQLAAIIIIGTIAYVGLGFMNGSGGIANTDQFAKAKLATIKTLPPMEYHPTDLKLSVAPKIRCASAIVIDNNTDQILYNKNADRKRSIASITKLLAAVVLVESDFDLDKKITLTKWDARNSASSRLKVGEKFLARDLFYSALICSDNRAIKALSRTCGLPYPEFIKKMNAKAKELGMDSTSAVDPSGIFNGNISTARDCVKLLNYAIKHPIIKSALKCGQYELRSLNHKRRIRIVNTNRLLKSKWKVEGGKTGYISASGYCLVSRLLDDSGSDITTVVLGSPSNGYRFSETRKIAQWAFKNLNHKLALGGK
jgi:serine-type D-Ala-D-Ala endopeptidase (penicillin-binding protein 7)